MKDNSAVRIHTISRWGRKYIDIDDLIAFMRSAGTDDFINEYKASKLREVFIEAMQTL